MYFITSFSPFRYLFSFISCKLKKRDTLQVQRTFHDHNLYIHMYTWLIFKLICRPDYQTWWTHEFATHSLKKLSRGTQFATVCTTQKSRERDNNKERDEERNKNGKRKETKRGWLSCCRRRPISGSGALIHFILCAFERRSIKVGKSYRDSTPAQKSGGGRDDRVVRALESWNRFCFFTPNQRTMVSATSTIVDHFRGVALGNSRSDRLIDTGRCDYKNFNR